MFMATNKLYLDNKLGGGEITIDDREFDNPRSYCLLLSYMITQAMSDGMTMVRIGIDRTTFEAYLQYYGPTGYDNPRWWDMTPPPKCVFPYILQYLMSIASVECGMPIQGKIQVKNKHKFLETEHKKLTIDICMPDLYTIELKWPESFAKSHDWSQHNQINAMNSCPDTPAI